MRFIAVYLLFDCLSIVFSSALRGAGDTVYVMYVVLICAPLLPLFCYVGIRYYDLGVIWCWVVLTASVFAYCGCFTARFFGGQWERMRVTTLAGISSNMATVSGTDFVGGVCGANLGTITACYNTGTVEGGSFVGGVCGWNDDTITACYFLDRGIGGVGLISGGTPQTTPFGDGSTPGTGWPADGAGADPWDVDTSGDGSGGYWKDLGEWNGDLGAIGTSTAGITGGASTFPKLWWEQ